MTTQTLFPHAPDNPSSGPPSYAQTLLRLNYQYYLTGIIEICYAPEKQFTLLISEGALVGTYHLKADKAELVSSNAIETLWTSGDAHIRSMALPREAVRSARAIIEWQPASETQTLTGISVQSFVDKHKSQGSSGLIQLEYSRGQGVVFLQGGKVINSNSVLSSPTGVEIGSRVVWNIMNNFEGPCTAKFYKGQPASISGTQLKLRLSAAEWFQACVGRYQQMVGRSLVGALDIDLNNQMQAKTWNVRVTGDSLSDSHLFPSTEAMSQCYQLLIRLLARHMANVIGANLTHTILTDTFNRLEPAGQSALNAQGINPALARS